MDQGSEEREEGEERGRSEEEVGTRKSPRQHDVKVFYKESSSEEVKKKVGLGVSFVNPAPSQSSV